MLTQSNVPNKVAPKDIQVVAENKQGSDWLVGDIHGMIDVFKLVIAKLSPNDRLFIVGDLVDRGAGSLEVLQMIQNINAQHPTQKIYAVIGNHEEGYLNLYNAYHANSKNYKQLQEAEIQLVNAKEKINQYEPSSPEALSTRDTLEIEAKKYNEAKLACIDANQWYEDEFKFLLSLENNWAVEKTEDGMYRHLLSDSQMDELATLLASLPYIIRVEGDKPFNVVHAHMPISQNTLLNHIAQGNLHLTADEKYIATETKNNFPLESLPTDDPTYSGHIVLGGIRGEASHINIDSGIFMTGIACLVNHQRKTAELIGDPTLAEAKYVTKNQSEFTKACHSLKNQISVYLNGSLVQHDNNANKENHAPATPHKLKAPKRGSLFNKSIKRKLENDFLKSTESTAVISTCFMDLSNQIESINFMTYMDFTP